MNIIQELEEEYKIDEALMKPLLDTTETFSVDCDAACGFEKTKEIIATYQKVLAKKLGIRNEKIHELTQKCIGDKYEVLQIASIIERLPKQDLDVIIEFINYIKEQTI